MQMEKFGNISALRKLYQRNILEWKISTIRYYKHLKHYDACYHRKVALTAVNVVARSYMKCVYAKAIAQCKQKDLYQRKIVIDIYPTSLCQLLRNSYGRDMRISNCNFPSL